MTTFDLTSADVPTETTGGHSQLAALPVSEVFGPTLQGEGVSIGRPASFVRLGGCNLHCSWCDTPWTWDARRFRLHDEITTREVRDVVDQVMRHGTPLVVVTGGEPMLHMRRPGWRRLVGSLVDAGREVEVETNGTVAPDEWTASTVTRFTVSPKLAHAGDPAAARLRTEALRALVATGGAWFKFVCSIPADLDEVAEVVRAAEVPADRVMVMPRGTTAAEVVAGHVALSEAVARRGWRSTTRLHVLAWGDERGR